MLYIGNHTTSSKGYENMAKQMIKNGGNTFAFLPGILVEEMPRQLTKKTLKNFFSWQKTIILASLLPMRPIP